MLSGPVDSQPRAAPHGLARPTTPVAFTARRQAGLSLIELMVGLVLGMLVVIACGMVFLSTRQSGQSTEGLSRMQETTRLAFELMARELREAGGTPCDNTPVVTNVLNGFQGASPAWWSDWNTTLQGFAGTTVTPGVAFGTAAGTRISGTDAVTVKLATDLTDLKVVSHDAANAVFTVSNSPHRAVAGDVLMACTYGQAAIFGASAISATTISHASGSGTAANCSPGLGVPTTCGGAGPAYTFQAGSKIGRLVASTWYVGNNGRPATGGRSLFRATRLGSEEIAEGVDNLQLSYLESGGASYVNATTVTNWSNVVALRVTLTLLSAETGASTRADTRLQRDVSFTLNLRNRQL